MAACSFPTQNTNDWADPASAKFGFEDMLQDSSIDGHPSMCRCFIHEMLIQAVDFNLY